MINLRSVTFTVCLATLGSVSIHAQVTGSGTTDYVPLWSSSSALTNSLIYQKSGNIGINNTSPLWALDVNGHINTSLGFMIGTNLVLAIPGGSSNIGAGYQALNSTSSGTVNAAVGDLAMYTNTTGSSNAAVGATALYSNSTAGWNTAIGYAALYKVTSAGNTAVGANALGYATTGGNNIGIGFDAGVSAPASVANSIYIGSQGAASDSGVTRIGTQNTQTSFFAAGISGVNVSGVPVLVNSSGQLGVASSSRRFKEDIQDMGDSSSGLLRLRPVTFRYKQAYDDGSKPLDYGLIAEEVAEVYPDLAVKGADGQIQTVQYQKLTPMLLNELQKQAEIIRGLEKRLEAVESSVHAVR